MQPSAVRHPFESLPLVSSWQTCAGLPQCSDLKLFLWLYILTSPVRVKRNLSLFCHCCSAISEQLLNFYLQLGNFSFSHDLFSISCQTHAPIFIIYTVYKANLLLCVSSLQSPRCVIYIYIFLTLDCIDYFI